MHISVCLNRIQFVFTSTTEPVMTIQEQEDMAYKLCKLPNEAFAAYIMEIVELYKQGKASQQIVEWVYVVAKTRQRLIAQA